MNKFRHVSDWGEARFSEELGINLVQFLNEAYLNIGAFQNVYLDNSGAYGGELSRLRPLDDPRYESGQVWQAFRKNWVWETPDYVHQPIHISGIYVGGTFQPKTGVGPYQFNINYPDGLIIFDSGIPISADVQMEYSYKLVSIYDDRSDWFKTIQYDSQRADHAHFNQYGSGAYDVLAQNRVQLPAIVVQPLGDVLLRGREVGAHNYRWQTALLHVFAENSWDKRTITDDLVNQKDARLFFFDYDKVLQSGAYPLLYDGTLNPSGLQFSSLIAEGVAYRHRDAIIENVIAEDYGDTMPHRSMVSWQLSIYI